MERNERPWGYYQVVDSGPGYKVKRIVVNPRSRLSYQSHNRREEHWFIVVGTGVITVEGVDRLADRGNLFFIPAKTKHRIANNGPSELIFIEVQLGAYLEEDDIERYEDDYGRIEGHHGFHYIE